MSFVIIQHIPFPTAYFKHSLESLGLEGAVSRNRQSSPMYCMLVHLYFRQSSVNLLTENFFLPTMCQINAAVAVAKYRRLVYLITIVAPLTRQEHTHATPPAAW